MIRPYISIIIPAYNEEKNIESTISLITGYLISRALSYEVLVINDGSTDHTEDIVRKLANDSVHLISHPHNLGKGAAVRTGMLAAQGDYRLFIDADHQIKINYLDQALPELKNGADIVIGSTQIPFSWDLAFQYRFYLGNLAKWLIRIVMAWSIEDTQRGFKIFTAQAAQDIFPSQTIIGWGFDIEVLAIAKERGLKIAQIPIMYSISKSTNVSSWSYLTALQDLLIIKLNTFRGAYSRGHVTAWKILGLLIVPVIVFFSPVLFFGKIFFDGDALTLLYPYAAFAQHHAGSIWNTLILSGFPVGASTTSFSFYSPLAGAVLHYAGFIAGYNILITLGFIGAILFSYWFSRGLGLSQPAAVLVASVYTFNQWNTHWMSNVLLINAILILPALFLAVQKIFKGRRYYFLLLALTVGFGFTAVHPQFAIMTLISAILYALYLSVEYWGNNFKINLKPLMWVALGLLVGIILGGSQLINSSIFGNLSTRNQGVTFQSAMNESAALPLDFAKYFIPHLAVRSLTAQEFYPYVGFLPLIFGLLALMVLWKKDKRIHFFGSIFLMAIIISVKYSPLFWLMLKLPVLDYFRGPSRWMMIGNFALAVLVGLGLEHLLLPESISLKSKILKIAKWATLMIMALGLVGTIVYGVVGARLTKIVQDFFDSHLYAHTTHLSLSYYHDLIAVIIRSSFSNISLTDPRFIIVAVFAGLSWLALRRLFAHQANERSSWIVVVVVISNLMAVGWVNTSFAGQGILVIEPPIAQFIKTREQSSNDYRVMSFLIDTASSEKITATHPGHTQEGFQYIFDGLGVNSNLLWDIPTADGFDTIANRRGQELFAEAGSETSQLSDAFSNQPISIDEKITEFVQHTPLLAMLNVKYIVSAYALPSVPALTLLKTFSSTSFSIPLYLYQDNIVLPRVYFARNVAFLPTADEIGNEKIITNTKNNFSQQSFIECNECSDRGVSFWSDQLEVSDYQDGAIDIKTQTKYSRWLIISESNLPHWVATIDGKSASIETANYIFQGVFIPAGSHLITLKYQPPFSLKNTQ